AAAGPAGGLRLGARHAVVPPALFRHHLLRHAVAGIRGEVADDPPQRPVLWPVPVRLAGRATGAAFRAGRPAAQHLVDDALGAGPGCRLVVPGGAAGTAAEEATGGETVGGFAGNGVGNGVR